MLTSDGWEQEKRSARSHPGLTGSGDTKVTVGNRFGAIAHLLDDAALFVWVKNVLRLLNDAIRGIGDPRNVDHRRLSVA